MKASCKIHMDSELKEIELSCQRNCNSLKIFLTSILTRIVTGVGCARFFQTFSNSFWTAEDEKIVVFSDILGGLECRRSKHSTLHVHMYEMSWFWQGSKDNACNICRLTSVSLSNNMMSRLSVSSGIVPRTKVTVEITTTDIEVKANI